jgi:hypothetical protein
VADSTNLTTGSVDQMRSGDLFGGKITTAAP